MTHETTKQFVEKNPKLIFVSPLDAVSYQKMSYILRLENNRHILESCKVRPLTTEVSSNSMNSFLM